MKATVIPANKNAPKDGFPTNRIKLPVFNNRVQVDGFSYICRTKTFRDGSLVYFWAEEDGLYIQPVRELESSINKDLDKQLEFDTKIEAKLALIKNTDTPELLSVAV